MSLTSWSNLRFFNTLPSIAVICLALMGNVLNAQHPNLPTDRPVTIMPLGDSITEGGPFWVYRYPLMEKLVAAGYNVKYVGSKTTRPKKDSPLGELAHEGYGGKNVSEIELLFKAHYPEYPADIVLMHVGHNQFADKGPVPAMIKNTRGIIEFARSVNPKVIVLLGQVITSGKLPKYSYIPVYNAALVDLAAELNTPQQPVILVNHAEGFDPATDTVGDQVHPNEKGGEKMAQKWFEALRKILPGSPAR